MRVSHLVFEVMMTLIAPRKIIMIKSWFTIWDFISAIATVISDLLPRTLAPTFASRSVSKRLVLST